MPDRTGASAAKVGARLRLLDGDQVGGVLEFSARPATGAHVGTSHWHSSGIQAELQFAGRCGGPRPEIVGLLT
jgi:hypothetical protein